MTDFYKKWTTQNHVDSKIKLVEEIIKPHIKEKPKNILDIGCGRAIESEYLQKEYGSHLYLMEGSPIPGRNRLVSWGRADTFNFYNDVELLKEDYNRRNLQYTFLDIGESTDIPEITFDFIFSFLSCGFHYSVEEYISMIRQHSDENTLIMFDIRKHKFNEQMKYFKECDIIQTESKYHKVKVKL